MEHKHEIKSCQRCGTAFECQPDSISSCQCRSVALSREQRDYIGSRYNDCLCAVCMHALGEEFNQLRRRENTK